MQARNKSKDPDEKIKKEANLSRALYLVENFLYKSLLRIPDNVYIKIIAM